MKKVCGYCEEPIHISKGQQLKHCAICKRATCDRDVFPCMICGNTICKADLVNYDPLRVIRKSSDWAFLKCKSCAKTEVVISK